MNFVVQLQTLKHMYAYNVVSKFATYQKAFAYSCNTSHSKIQSSPGYTAVSVVQWRRTRLISYRSADSKMRGKLGSSCIEPRRCSFMSKLIKLETLTNPLSLCPKESYRFTIFQKSLDNLHLRKTFQQERQQI